MKFSSFGNCYPFSSACRTVTQEDPGDNQVTLEEITQMVREEITRAQFQITERLFKNDLYCSCEITCVFCV